MSTKFSEQSRIFRDFRSIPYSDYYYLIRFYEQNTEDIQYLPLDEGLVMAYYYANALFETQEYQLFVPVANDILEQSIIHNIRYIDGEDVYMMVLYKKACAHLRLEETDTALHLANQLLRLEPQRFEYQALVRQCFLVTRPNWLRPILTMSAVATLMGAFTTVVLFSFPEHLPLPSKTAIMPFSLLSLATLGLFATAYGYYRYVVAPSRELVQQAKTNKAIQEKEEAMLLH